MYIHTTPYGIETPVERYNSTQRVPLNTRETIPLRGMVTVEPVVPESINALDMVIDAPA